MRANGSETVASGLVADFQILEPEKPNFGLCKAIPEGMSKQIETAVRDFIVSSNIPPNGLNIDGFYHQTIQAIANAAIIGQGLDLWLGTYKNELWTYILGHIGNDYDGRLAYTVTQAWVRKDQRGQPWVRKAWEKVRQRAKDCLCHHFAVISTKDRTNVYCRFLGKDFRKYAEILKEVI